MVTTNALGITSSGLVTYDGAGTFSATTYTNTTFVPVLTFGGGSTSITYSSQLGTYTVIGNSVSITINLALTSKGSSTGIASISGLPFTSAATNLFYVIDGYLLGMNSFPGTTTIPIGLILATSTNYVIYVH